MVLRAEGTNLFTDDPNGTDPTVGNRSFHVVPGAETVVPGAPRVIARA